MPTLIPHFDDGNQANPTPILFQDIGRSFFIKSDKPAEERTAEENTEIVFEGLATLTRRWIPNPHLEITFEGLTIASHSDKVTRVEIGELPFKTGNVNLKYRNLEKTIYQVPQVSVGEPERLVAVDFHVFNMIVIRGRPSDESGAQSRLVFEYDKWEITLDSVRSSDDSKALMEEGYALTHVGRIVRKDGKEFKFDTTEKLILLFQFFLSFARGGWVGIDHFVGLNNDLKPCYQSWRTTRISSGYPNFGWLPDMRGDTLELAFPSFANRFNDPAWNEVLRLALDFYIQANLETTIESRLILVQIALEALSHTINASSGWLHEDVFEDKLPASDRLRLVLVWAGIPLDELSLAKEGLTGEGKPWSKWVSGADVISDLRNWIVHSTPGNRKKLELIPPVNRYWAGQLSLWHLELVLLKLFGYDGQYRKRIRTGIVSRLTYDDLPWTKPRDP